MLPDGLLDNAYHGEVDFRSALDTSKRGKDYNQMDFLKKMAVAKQQKQEGSRKEVVEIVMERFPDQDADELLLPIEHLLTVRHLTAGEKLSLKTAASVEALQDSIEKIRAKKV